MSSPGILLAVKLLSVSWKNFVWIVIAWGIGGGLGWYFAKELMIGRLNMDWGTSWSTGMGIGWTIAGLGMAWQLLKMSVNKVPGKRPA